MKVIDLNRIVLSMYWSSFIERIALLFTTTPELEYGRRNTEINVSNYAALFAWSNERCDTHK